MKKAVALGDSITWGYPWGKEASWVSLLQEKFAHILWLNRGVNGDTFKGMVGRLKKDVLAENPDLCILTGGINDAFAGYSLPEMENFVVQILEELWEADIVPVLGIPVSVLPSWGCIEKKVARVQAMLDSLARQREVSILDFRVLGPEDYQDEVHPNRRGYEKMGKVAIHFFESFQRFWLS